MMIQGTYGNQIGNMSQSEPIENTLNDRGKERYVSILCLLYVHMFCVLEWLNTSLSICFPVCFISLHPVRAATSLQPTISQTSGLKPTPLWPSATSESCLGSDQMTTWWDISDDVHWEYLGVSWSALLLKCLLLQTASHEKGIRCRCYDITILLLLVFGSTVQRQHSPKRWLCIMTN